MEGLHVAAEIAEVANAYAVALPPFDGGGDILSTYGRHDVSLHAIHGKPVTRQRVAFQIEVQEVPSACPLGVHTARARNLRQGPLDFLADGLNLV